MSDQQPGAEGAAPVTVTVVNFGRASEVEVPEGSTVAAVLQEAGIDPASTIRFRGETLDGEQREIIGVTADETIVAAPPRVSHG